MNKKIKLWRLCIIAVLIIAITTSIITIQYNSTHSNNSSISAADAQKQIEEYAEAHDIDYNTYPQKLIEMLEKNPETKDFVLEYPIEKDKQHKINLNKYKNSTQVPLFMQWDQHWGYEKYGDDIIAFNGCGPTCLSMVAVYLLNDTSMSPKWMADFALENGYQSWGNGSKWTLISEGGKKLGLDVTEIPLDENRLIKNLEVGNPVICVMGPGDFTTTGHFIVLTGYKNGEITINDPNSIKNSEKKWKYSDISNQINNLWVIRK